MHMCIRMCQHMDPQTHTCTLEFVRTSCFCFLLFPQATNNFKTAQGRDFSKFLGRFTAKQL